MSEATLISVDEIIQECEELLHQLTIEDTNFELILNLEAQRSTNIRSFFNQPQSKINLIPSEKFTHLLELDKLINNKAAIKKDKLTEKLKQFKKNNKAANAYKNL